MTDTASILIVDDRPEKLLALEAVLEDLGQEIVRAYSGREALRQVLARDFAVILLDVNMPDMDGFETASMIRQRRSSEHTPIIFVTAFGDEFHAAQGYSLGAVDYILAPVLPDVLRTKVAVFVDLFKKTEQLRSQADWLRDRAGQLHKLTAASLAINSALSVDAMLRVVTDTARQIIGAHQACTTAALGPRDTRAVRVASFSDKYPDAEACCGVMDSTDAHQAVRQSNRPLRLTQAEAERNHGHSSAPVGESYGGNRAPGGSAEPPIRGWLAAPLTGRDGRNLGLIQLSDRCEGDFTNDDEAILVQIAQMASIALENSLFAEERESNRMKDEFLATLSHELRTPLNAIIGWTHLLRMESTNGVAANSDSSPPVPAEKAMPLFMDPAELAHGLEVIDRNARSQTKLIEDLLDVSRITTGKMRLSVRPVQLGPILYATTDTIRPAADAKRIEIDCDLDPQASEATVSGDPDRLQQVFWNLLSNATKFTPAGGRITCRLDRAGESLRLRVTDTGNGIEPKFLPYVFDRFRQADASSTRVHGGLGIGLTIVRHIVELHGGSVGAESAGDAQGSTFTVILPTSLMSQSPERVPSAAPAARLPHAVAKTPELNGLRVLLVDDESDAREVICAMLVRSGAQVFPAASVREALDLLARHRPDVLLSDIAMPDEDGYALIRKVRERPPQEGGATPAVAVTAYARDEDRQRAMSAGFQAHIAKPVDPRELIRTLAGVGGGSAIAGLPNDQTMFNAAMG